MRTRKHWNRASRRRALARGARRILLDVAHIVTTLILAPPISIVVVPLGRLIASIRGARVERTAVFP
jgi:hypothetical protein